MIRTSLLIEDRREGASQGFKFPRELPSAKAPQAPAVLLAPQARSAAAVLLALQARGLMGRPSPRCCGAPYRWLPRRGTALQCHGTALQCPSVRMS
jgi:hypothetical protein